MTTGAWQGEGTTRRADLLRAALALGLLTASVAFFVTVVTVQTMRPGYFERLVFAGYRVDIDPMTTGATQKAGSEAASESGITPLPVPGGRMSERAEPEDYAIVMVFEHEAHLATEDDLWRVEVGSRLPGLGTILAIEPGANGGTVRAERATLTGVPAMN